MNTKNTLITFLLVATLFSCNKQNSFSDFKYADKTPIFECEGVNSKLYNEALYSFEDDVLNHYKGQQKGNTLANAYSKIIRSARYNDSEELERIVSQHTLKVFDALKNEGDLWDAENRKSHLNYNSKVMKCIAENIKDEALKKTLSALLATNSMSPKLYAAPLTAKYRNALKDKNLGLYVALDLYYSKLFDTDLSKVSFDEPEEEQKAEEAEENKTPAAVTPPAANTATPSPVDSHEGHNH